MREASVERPVSAQQPRREMHGLLVGVVRPIGERRRTAELSGERLGGHVDGTAERSGAVGRDTGATLDLHVADGRDEVGRIVPIHRMGIGVVHRHAVDRHVQTCGVRAAQPHRSAADADAGFVGGDHRGREGQHGGDVVTEAVAGDLLARNGRIGHGRRPGGARGGYLDLLEPVHAHGIVGMHGIGSRQSLGKRCVLRSRRGDAPLLGQFFASGHGDVPGMDSLAQGQGRDG